MSSAELGVLERIQPYDELFDHIAQARDSIFAGLDDGSIEPCFGVFATTCLNLLEGRVEEVMDEPPRTPRELLDEALALSNEPPLEVIQRVPIHAPGVELMELQLSAAAQPSDQ